MRFTLKELNLSNNPLGYLLNYVTEIGLINPQLELLLLFNCQIDDEQLLKLADSKRVEALVRVDLGNNLLDQNVMMSVKLLRENCAQLQDLMLNGNKNVKNCGNFQIQKPKRS